MKPSVCIIIIIIFTNTTHSTKCCTKKIKSSPELFTAQDFDVTTALLYLSRGRPVRFQVFVIKGDLQKEPNLVYNQLYGWHIEGAQRSHLTSFSQEVYGVVSFQEGRHCETVEEHQITICVSLRLEQRSSCSVTVTHVILGVKTWTQSKHSTLVSDKYSDQRKSFVQIKPWLSHLKKLYYVFNYNRAHAFGFLTGSSSLTVVACTSTSLNACLGSKNLLSILSGATKPENKTNKQTKNRLRRM